MWYRRTMQDKTTIEGYEDVAVGQEISKNNSTWFRIERIDPPEGPADDPFGDHSGEAELVCVESQVGNIEEGETRVIDAVNVRTANGWEYVREGEQ